MPVSNGAHDMWLNCRLQNSGETLCKDRRFTFASGTSMKQPPFRNTPYDDSRRKSFLNEIRQLGQVLLAFAHCVIQRLQKIWEHSSGCVGLNRRKHTAAISKISLYNYIITARIRAGPGFNNEIYDVCLVSEN